MRLIDADALKKYIGCADATKYGNKTAEQQHNSYSTMMMYEIADCIDDMEAVDAAPVRCGEWIESYSYGCWHYDCPFCDDGYATQKRQYNTEGSRWNYCPNCGAKMDGGKQDGAVQP